MDCSYCYASTEDGAGTYGEGSLMTDEIAYRGVDLLFEKSLGDKVEIVFFGGEPLLNFPLIRKVVKYAEKESFQYNKKVSYLVVTNATLLTDEIIRFFADEKIFIQVSLDGIKEINDRHRKFPDGRGSHDIIVGNVEKLVNFCGDHVRVHATLTKDGLHCLETIQYFLNLGFKNITFAPVYTLDQCISLDKRDMRIVKKELESYAVLFKESALGWKMLNDGQFLDILRILHKVERDINFQRKSFCGAGGSMLAISSGGDIYPCHSFIGIPEYKIGDVFQGISQEALRKYNSFTKLRKQNCSSCWAEILCGGGCAYAAYIMNKSIIEPYEILCIFLRIIYRLSIEIFDEIKGKDPEVIEYLCKPRSFEPVFEKLLELMKGNGE